MWLRQELQNADRSGALFVGGVRKLPVAWLNGGQQACPGAESRLSRQEEQPVLVGRVHEGEKRPVWTGPEEAEDCVVGGGF